MILAITGVTGHLGRQLAECLSAAGVPARLLARRPEAAPRLPHMTVHKAYYDRSSTTLAALKGVDVLFMVSAKESANRIATHKALVDAAHQAGVKHIVYTSFYAADESATFTLARDHAATERYIREKGLTYTFIRDNFYMDFFVNLCRDYGQIKGPAGHGKVSMVAREDVVAVAQVILQQPRDWENQQLDMTGPESLSMAEVVDRVGQAWGYELPYIQETVAEAYQSRQAWPAEAWEYDSWVSTYTAIASGELAPVSSDIARILGRQPLSLQAFLDKHRFDSI